VLQEWQQFSASDRTRWWATIVLVIGILLLETGKTWRPSIYYTVTQNETDGQELFTLYIQKPQQAGISE
jgi:hypothetical protein